MLFYFFINSDIIYTVIILNKNIAWLKDIKIAHRGLHSIKKRIPENTIAAFEKAIEQNIAIELDIHILKDNTLVVFHDNDLKRSSNVDKKLKYMTFNEVKNISLFNTGYKTPTLIDTLDFIDGRVPVIIEVKTDVPAKRICPYLLDILKQYKGKVAIKSFDPLVCFWFKKHAPQCIRGLLVSDFKKEKKHKLLKQALISSLIFMPLCKPDFLSTSISMLKSKKMKRLHSNGHIILGWTFRNKFDLIKYKDYCDSYIFEEGEII